MDLQCLIWYTYLVTVSPVLMLGPIAGVGESFRTAGVLAGVGFLPGMASKMGLQILQPGVSFAAALELK